MFIGECGQISTCNSFILFVMIGHGQLSFCAIANNSTLMVTTTFASLCSGR